MFDPAVRNLHKVVHVADVHEEVLAVVSCCIEPNPFLDCRLEVVQGLFLFVQDPGDDGHLVGKADLAQRVREHNELTPCFKGVGLYHPVARVPMEQCFAD